MSLKRIKEIAKYAKGYKRIADIGSDHGYLIIEAFNNHHIEYAMAVENKKGPLNNCIKNLQKYDFYNNVKFSLSNGIENVENVEAIFICGMGGRLISQIIENSLDKIKNEVLILEPNRNSYELRLFLQNNGFKIVDEEIIKDDFYYNIIVCERGKMNLNEIELKYGKINIESQSKCFKEYLKNKLERLTNIKTKTIKNEREKDEIRSLLNDY